MLPTQPLNAPKILIVDDSWTVLTHLASMLAQRGFAVDTATDGEEALAKVRLDQPNCILLDVVLPKRNGFQVCRELKHSMAYRHIPIILMSSKSTPTDQMWGLQQGADTYLVKPFSEQDLVTSIRKLLWPAQI